MFLLSLLGCEESLPEDTQVPDPDPPTGLVLRVEPVALDFGRVELGESRDKTVTITNKGDSLVFLAEFGFEDPGLTIESPGFHIQPSESVEVLVNWAPPYPGELEDTLQVLAGENPAELSPCEVTLEGHVDGPTMVIA